MPRKNDSRDKQPNKLIVPILIFAFLGGVAAVVLLTPNSPSAEDILASRQDSSNGNVSVDDEFATDPNSVIGKYKFEEIQAVVSATNTSMLIGDSLDAQIVISGINPTANPSVVFDDPNIDARVWVENGVVRMRVPSRSEGSFNVSGNLNYKGKSLPFSTNYSAHLPSLQVIPSKQNIIYKGVDNPVLIYVPDVDPDDIRPSISNGSIRRHRSPNMYIVRVRSGNNATVSVSAQLPDDERMSIGRAELRVKSVPNPVPYFAGKGQGDTKVKKRELEAAQGVAARLENFDFDMRFTVTSFKLDVILSDKVMITKTASGNRLTGEMKAMMKKVKPGNIVIIREIRAKGPDNIVRKLGALYLKVV